MLSFQEGNYPNWKTPNSIPIRKCIFAYIPSTTSLRREKKSYAKVTIDPGKIHCSPFEVLNIHRICWQL